jgi:hypothetical protein
MRFPDTWRTKEENIFFIVYPAAVQEIDYFRFSDPFDPAKIKLVDFLDDWKMRAGHIPLHTAFNPIRDLSGKDGIEERDIGLFPDLRVIYHFVQIMSNTSQIQGF